jgi:hypothetical protein
MRLLLLLILIGVGAYFTVPNEAAQSEAAHAFLEGRAPGEESQGLSLDNMVGYVKGMLAGEGRYENFYLASKYTMDLPGPAYIECWGGFTVVQCREAAPEGQRLGG